MRRHADDALAQVEGELQPLRAAVAASDEAREASELCARFGEALKPLPDEALRRLAEVAPGLQAVVRAAVTRCSEDPSIGDHDLATRAAEAFHQEAGNWLLDALKQVRGRMATPVRRLGDCLTELTGLLNRITPLPEEPGRPEGQETTQKLGDLPRGPGEEIATVDLSPADVAQRKLAVTTAMASAGLATVLLVAGGPVPFVLGTAAVAVQRLLASQQMAEANRRKLRALVMETCNLQLGRLERQVHDDFLQAWRAYAAQIRSRYEPLRRALLGEIAAHPGWRDPKLRPRFQELSKRHAELSDIRSQIEVVEPASAAVDADV
jgi:hypothetical protein